jgi:hypothetical protein
MNTDAPDRLTREKLYELVWSEPIATLAQAMGSPTWGLRRSAGRSTCRSPTRGTTGTVTPGLYMMATHFAQDFEG